jgi:hypothetical protein
MSPVSPLENLAATAMETISTSTKAAPAAQRGKGAAGMSCALELSALLSVVLAIAAGSALFFRLSRRLAFSLAGGIGTRMEASFVRVSECRYFAVASNSECPISSWTVRMSTP